MLISVESRHEAVVSSGSYRPVDLMNVKDGKTWSLPKTGSAMEDFLIEYLLVSKDRNDNTATVSLLVIDT